MRAGDWAEVNALLDESSTGWGLGEYRAMTQAASQVTDWQGALRLLERMEADGKPADAAAYGHAVAACAKADQPTEGRSLLDKLQKAGVMAEARGYNQVMSSFARQRRWSEALGLLREMCAAGVTPTVISYNAALSACSKAGRWNEAIELLGEMEAGRSKGGGSVPAPDVISYSTVISACQKASTGTMGASASAALDTALELLERMRCSSKVPVPTDSAIVPDEGTAEVPKTAPVANVFTYTSAITALADAGRWEEALKTYASIPDDVEKNDAIVNAAVCAASVGGDWVTARSVLEEALLVGVTPRTSSFNMAINTAAGAHQPAAALAILRRMRTAGVRRNQLTYNAALSALEAGGRWQQALRLLRDMRRARVAPSLISYNLALGACAKAAKISSAKVSSVTVSSAKVSSAKVSSAKVSSAKVSPLVSNPAADAAMELLLELQQLKLQPDVTSYSSAIAALSDAGQWERLGGLLGSTQAELLQPNGFSFSAAIAACESAGEWERLLALFAGLRKAGGAVDRSLWNAALSAAACAPDAGTETGVDLALSLLGQMTEEGYAPDLHSYNALLKACERAADWDTAIETLSIMKSHKIVPDAISYTSAVGALGRAREWEKALSLWLTMLTDGISPDTLALRTLLRALSGAAQWPTALAVFDAVANSEDAHVCTTPVYEQALTACAVGAQPERAARYIEQMKCVGVDISSACYAQLASAHAAARDWRGALAVFKGLMADGLRPDAPTYQAVYSACDQAGAQEEAKALLEFAERQGVPLIAIVGEGEGDDSISGSG